MDNAPWADQLLPKLLMERFDILPIQCRHIKHMYEGVWFGQYCFQLFSTALFGSGRRSHIIASSRLLYLKIN